MEDMHHLDTQMRKHQKDAQTMRQLAQTERDKANRYRGDGDEGQMNYHLRQAEQREADALQHDQDFEEARSKHQAAEAQLRSLEQQRDMLQPNDPRRSAIENDIHRLRGTSFSL